MLDRERGPLHRKFVRDRTLAQAKHIMNVAENCLQILEKIAYEKNTTIYSLELSNFEKPKLPHLAAFVCVHDNRRISPFLGRFL